MADKFWSRASISDPADLREEFQKLIDGHGAFDGIGTYLVHRKLNTTRCECWDSVDGSSSDCKYCQGESYKWTEEYVLGYFTQTFGRALAGATTMHRLESPGYFDQDKALVYLKHDAEVSTGDAIYRIRLNDEGNIYYPIERIEKWRVVNVEDKRYDRARLAYNLCLCEREEV